MLIEHDYHIAELIREALLSEPKGSAGYAVSKGIMNRLKEKYRDREGERLVRRLKQTVKHETRKEMGTHEETEGQHDTETIRSSASGAATVHEAIPAESSGEG